MLRRRRERAPCCHDTRLLKFVGTVVQVANTVEHARASPIRLGRIPALQNGPDCTLYTLQLHLWQP